MTQDLMLHDCVCPMCLAPSLAVVPRKKQDKPELLGTQEVICNACDERMAIVLGVPYLGRFTRADLLSVLEVTSYLHDFVVNDAGNVTSRAGGSVPSKLGDGYRRIQDMLDTASDRDGTGVDFPRFGFAAKPRWFPNRYEEFVQYRQVTDGISFDGKRVLDIGAGTGFDALRFNREGADVTALEYNPLQAAIGYMSFPGFRWVGSSVTHMPFPDESFDVVIANCALHHVLHLEDGLAEMLRVLKVGGHMLTIGDSYAPNSFTIDDEVEVFNKHPAVLRGVNEQVPCFERFLAPLLKERASLDIDVMTAVVHGLHKNNGTLRRWELADALGQLGKYRGGLCMRIRKNAPTPTRSWDTIKPDALVDVGEYVSNFASREHALRYLARSMPSSAVDLPMLTGAEIKLRLLLGWRKPVPSAEYREGVGSAYLFVSPRYVAENLPEFEILVSRDTAVNGSLRFVLQYDEEVVASSAIDRGEWVSVKPDLVKIEKSGHCGSSLLSFQIRDAEGNATDIPFRVRPPGVGRRSGLFARIKQALQV